MGGEFVRHPAVAGRFYPDDPADLRAEAQRTFRNHIRKIKCRFEPSDASLRTPAICTPGHVAGAVFAHMEIPERCIVLVPEPYGHGTAALRHERRSLGDASRKRAD